MNLTELNLYLHERRQIESDHYIDSFINLPIDVEKKEEVISMSMSMKRRYRLGLGLGRKKKDKIWW